jgi:TRAP-type mannitol/chloroaromatic compound transport system substrate-binding protein
VSEPKSNRRGFLRFLSLSSLGAAAAACLPSNQPAPSGASSGSSTQQTMTLKMQSTWGQKDLFHEIFLDWGKKVEEMSANRLKVDILPAGAVVGAFDLIDAVHSGTLDGGHGVPAYWFGKDRAASLFGTGPSLGMDANMVLGWVHYGGGQELYNDLIQKKLKLNVVSFFHGPMPTQPLGWFKDEIKSVDDFRGVKFRTVGMAIDIYSKMGATVVALPGGEVVPALERGALDAAEYNNTSGDTALGFPDVRKTYMVQSYHQPTEFLEITINKQKYDALPADLKAIIKFAAMAQSADMAWKFMDRNSKDLLALKQKGIRFVPTPRPVLDRQLQIWDEIIEKDSRENADFKKILDSQKEWARRVVAWHKEISVEHATDTAYRHFFR